MRFVQPEPSTAPKDIASRSYDINIRVSGVDSVQTVLIERLTVKIERHLRIGAEYTLIATNNAHSNRFDLACAICQGNQQAIASKTTPGSAYIAVLWRGTRHWQSNCAR